MNGSRKGTYLMRLESYNNGLDIAADSLDYLCGFVDDPFEDFKVGDIGVLAAAISAVNSQLQYMTVDLAGNEIVVNEEEGIETEYVVLEAEQVTEMAKLADLVDETTEALRDLCHISLEVN